MFNKLITRLLSPIGTVFLVVSIVMTTTYFISNRVGVDDGNNISTQALFNATFQDVNAKPQAIKQWQGKIIVLNFWATWCTPCREEMPELSALNTQYQNKNVIVLGVAIDEIGLIQEFAKENKISYPLLAAGDEGMELAAALGNNKGVLPYTIIIRPDGTVAKTYLGRISKSLLEETLIKLF
jgi:thiol-disulfide isomerase/thioredoxin